MNAIIQSVRAELQSASDESTRTSSLTFFKEEVKVYGVKSAVVRSIAKKYLREVKHLPIGEVFFLCEELWQSGYLEEGGIACEWASSKHKEFTADDFATFERWVASYVTNWASCDTFCNHTVGDFVVMYPEFVQQLKRWAHSDNRWVRRAAAVSLIVPAKKGEFLDDVFELADILLTDPDDMVQKGYGWLLKAAKEKHMQQVFEYVLSKRDVMPRTALRYAIEKMPKKLKTEAMKR